MLGPVWPTEGGTEKKAVGLKVEIYVFKYTHSADLLLKWRTFLSPEPLKLSYS